MKKIGFIVQVLTLLAALPILSILELNHVNKETTPKKTDVYVRNNTENKSVSFNEPGTSESPLLLYRL